jgi:protein TonB
MRKVYQAEKNSTGLITALIIGVGVTGVLFGIIPFTHMISKPPSVVQLVRASTADLPPPTENEPPPVAPEPEKPQEAPPELKMNDAPQQIALSADLEVATGTGGGLAGFGEMHKAAIAEATKDDAVDVQDLEKRPEPVSQPAPTYPKELVKAKVEGVVTLIFVLNEEGRVEDPRIENSSRPEFEKPALDAVRKWRFRPGMKDGQAVRTYLRYPIRFRVTSG